jgi:hypothetical protein
VVCVCVCVCVCAITHTGLAVMELEPPEAGLGFRV